MKNELPMTITCKKIKVKRQVNSKDHSKTQINSQEVDAMCMVGSEGHYSYQPLAPDKTINPDLYCQELIDSRKKIFYDLKCNLIAQQSLTLLQTAFDDEAPCKTTIYTWFTEFKRGRINLGDDFRGDYPSTAVNNNNVDTMRRIIVTDRHVTYHEIRACLGIGKFLVRPTYANMIHCCGVCRGDTAAALRLYTETYPDSQQPASTQVILRAVYRLRDNLP
ncbi:Putative uncharacterized protein FLJ37770 [Eumeta japonica]|uniref:Mos1 transposase HTH domain-containing protein n=1 Tax=Eumeta variegata TaxID=151549 RepID=A0A4C1ZRI3_EUMVA|nr:Putative uncharacterized protein FLJ37770 [Eumeta japonica]